MENSLLELEDKNYNLGRKELYIFGLLFIT